MNNIKRLEEQVAFAVKEALRLGATDCSVSVTAGESVETGVRLGEVEQLEGVACGLGLSLSIYVGKKSASTSTSDLRRRPLTKLIRDSVALARACQDDECAGLPERDELALSVPDLDLYDPALEKMEVGRKIELALAAEAAALAVDKRLSKSEGASFYDSRNTVVYANSRGFSASCLSSSCSLSAGVVASEGDEMRVGSWWASGRKLSDLCDPQSIGVKAAERALRQLGSRSVKSQAVPVVFDQLMAGRLLGQFATALAGTSIYRGSSFLAGKLGTQVAHESLQIVDDPLIPGGIGSRPYFGHGLPACKRIIVSNGRLECYLLDTYAARKLASKANGGSTSNLYIEPGKLSPEEIIASVQSGLYLTNVSGPGFNVVTGGYSLGASGIWIENGKLTYPVSGITVASTLPEMLNGIAAIGSDLEFRSSTNSPTLKIASMTIGGK